MRKGFLPVANGVRSPAPRKKTHEEILRDYERDILERQADNHARPVWQERGGEW